MADKQHGKRRLEDEPPRSPDVKIQSEGSHAGTPTATHELSDARVKPIFAFGLGLAVLVAATFALITWYYRVLERREQAGQRPLHPLAAEREVASDPRLQTMRALDRTLDTDDPTAPFSDSGWAEHAHETERVLSTYGWVDAATGTVRIPIERAIELTLEQGLPSSDAPPTKPAPEKR